MIFPKILFFYNATGPSTPSEPQSEDDNPLSIKPLLGSVANTRQSLRPRRI